MLTRYSQTWRHAIVLPFALWLLCGSAARCQGFVSTAPADLDQLVQQAQTIVRGRVTSVTTGPHPQFPNLQTVLITISTTKVLKGSVGPTLTFRQFQWDVRDPWASYKGAGEIVLFLNQVSPYGLTSPVGQEQGRFRVLQDAAGKRFVVNGRGNKGLFGGVSMKAASRGIALSRPALEMLSAPGAKPLLETFEDLVQSLAGAPK